MVFSAKSRTSAGTSSLGSIMSPILPYGSTITTFPERRPCGLGHAGIGLLHARSADLTFNLQTPGARTSERLAAGGRNTISCLFLSKATGDDGTYPGSTTAQA